MLSELEGRGWTMAEPPRQIDEENVVARLNGKPIKSGFLMDTVEQTRSTLHSKYRSGCYDLEVKIDFDILRLRVKVTEAEGYQ